MVTDSETNTLYLADTLPEKYEIFYADFQKVLTESGISINLLPNTKDVWAVDYMPIQVSENNYVQFTYDPNYLKPKKWAKTISNVNRICDFLQLKRKKSKIVLDGGNVIKASDKVIMCDKIFSENPQIERRTLRNQLEELFEVDKVYFVPEQPKDFTGHADGMVRFVTNDTVIINDNSAENKEFQRALKIALDNAGLDYIEIPCNYSKNKKSSQANGCYINYLQMKNLIILPTFGIEEDERVVKQFENIFKGHRIKTVDSNAIANDGGILNCITWNIKK